MNKIRPNKETLNQYIYDYGYDKALELFHLTEKQAEYILFGKKEKRREPVEYREEREAIILPINLEKTKPLFKAIGRHYEDLRNQYLKGKDKDKINIRSESAEDKFHNALIKIIENPDRFSEISEQDTFNYLKTRLFFESKTDRKRQQRERKKRIEVRQQEEFNNLLEKLKYHFENR